MKHEIEFPETQITLNIFNFLYNSTHRQIIVTVEPSKIIYDYYKSGTMLMASASANTYGFTEEPDRVASL